MTFSYVFEADACLISERRGLVLYERRNESLSQALVGSFVISCCECFFVICQHLVEHRHLAFKEFRPEDRRDLDILLIERDTGFTREYDQFSQYITTAEVKTWVRLGVSGILRPFHDFCKCSTFAACVIAEYIVQRAAEHSLDPDDLVSAVDAS